MNISTILVVAPVQRLDAALRAIADIPGVEVHHRHSASGRAIVTYEAKTIRDEVAGLERIKALPDVIMAEMVSHWFADDAAIPADCPPENSRTPSAVPAFFNDESAVESPQGKVAG
jgi:nitrate reductase NapAB chaperone NapD